MSEQVQIIIASYNRPDYLVRAIKSVLGQTHESFSLLISDNSTDDSVEEAVNKISDKRLSYKRRIPSLKAIDHLNAILDDVCCDKFMIFHDDDVMHPEMVDKLASVIDQHPNGIAAGSNAVFNINEKNSNRTFLKKSSVNNVFRGRDQLVERYLIKNGIVPFPSYMYKREVANKLRMDIEQGGKYCDVSFIMNVSDLGEVIFVTEPLMDYYIHKGQDTKTNDFLQRVKLVNYIVKTTKYKRNDQLVLKLRILNLYAELKSILISGRDISFQKYCRLLSLIFRVSPFEYFIKAVILTVSSKFVKK